MLPENTQIARVKWVVATNFEYILYEMWEGNHLAAYTDLGELCFLLLYLLQFIEQQSNGAVAFFLAISK